MSEKNDETETIENVEVIEEVEVVEEQDQDNVAEEVEAQGEDGADQEQLKEFTATTFSEEEMEEIEEAVKNIDYGNLSINDAFSRKDEINSSSDQITTKINSSTKVKHSGSKELLLEISQDINNMMKASSTSDDDSWMPSTITDFLGKIGLRKVKEEIDEIVDSNSTVEEMSDKVFDKFDKQTEKLREDVEDRKSLYETMIIQVKELIKERRIVEAKIEYISKLPKSAREEKLSLQQWVRHSNNLAGMIFQGKEDLDTIQLQLEQAIAAEGMWSQIRPDLKRQISTQLSLGIKNQENTVFVEALGVIRKFTNEISKRNLKEAGQNSVKMINEFNRPLLEKGTIDEMRKIKMDNAKEVKNAFTKTRKDMLEYRGKVENMLEIQDKTNYKALSYENAEEIQESIGDEVAKTEAKKEAQKPKAVTDTTTKQAKKTKKSKKSKRVTK